MGCTDTLSLGWRGLESHVVCFPCVMRKLVHPVFAGVLNTLQVNGHPLQLRHSPNADCTERLKLYAL